MKAKANVVGKKEDWTADDFAAMSAVAAQELHNKVHKRGVAAGNEHAMLGIVSGLAVCGFSSLTVYVSLYYLRNTVGV